MEGKSKEYLKGVAEGSLLRLFGIYLRDEWQITMKALPHIIGGKYRDNFLFFWSWITIVHDFGTEIENADATSMKISNLNEFLSHNNIIYNLIEDCKEGELLKNYFTYRLHVHNKIDHGIAAALKFYDIMMTDYKEDETARVNYCSCSGL